MEEYIIFIGIAFWLLYFANSFEDFYLKAYLKALSTGVIFICSFIPLTLVNIADKTGTYEIFNWVVGNGLIFFWVLWGAILFFQLLQRFGKLGGDKE